MYCLDFEERPKDLDRQVRKSWSNVGSTHYECNRRGACVVLTFNERAMEIINGLAENSLTTNSEVNND